ncbi:hypothetical protein L227DRAFT_115205 [Lentinus tigrinus ALCF2SS1-6]|uniref:Uncharacterized protein n=1 Tax=Lentinus tigrinus ALCF2SS1-6 TaxID=1328759 RepID=A0A5C2S992_9APHY|nr:hypothetical protein L227DRAFT_115205 [Lentinus tigrinus ALCF2SS1-6]
MLRAPNIASSAEGRVPTGDVVPRPQPIHPPQAASSLSVPPIHRAHIIGGTLMPGLATRAAVEYNCQHASAHPPRPSSSLREGARACDPALDPPAARETREPAIGGKVRRRASERATCGAGPRPSILAVRPAGPGPGRAKVHVRGPCVLGNTSQSPQLPQPNTAAPPRGRRRAIARLGRSCDESCGLVSA